MNNYQTKQLELIAENNPKDNWFSALQKAFNFNDEPGWPDRFSRSLRTWSKKNNVEIKTLSLFSGGGGLDLGFHDAGFKVLEMVEFEEKYVNTLKKNSEKWFDGAKANCIDIRDYSPEKLDIDFIIGGPPCQTFSAAGRRAKGVMGIDDPRGNLFKEYVRLLKKHKPKAFLFENVYALVGAQRGKPWQLIREGFQSVGYDIFYRVLDAADYGTPQHRERILVVGIRKDLNKKFKFPFPTHGPDSIGKIPHYSAGNAVSNLNTTEAIKPVNGKYGDLLDNIPPGLNYSFYTEKMGHPNPVFGWRSKFSDFLYKADPDRPVRAIKAQGGQYTGPFSWANRFFHLSELKRLQTFPDEYEIVGSRNVVVEQIGNSVPPQIARIMALAVLDQIFDVDLPVDVPYLPEDFELGFRTRKRQLTKEYNKKAQEAILKQGLKNKVKRQSETFIPDGNETRYLTVEKMKWKKRKDPNSKTVHLNYISIGKVLEISASGSTKNSDKEERYQVIVSPKLLWKLPYQKVLLKALTQETYIYTALWKAFEEKVSDFFNYADLVQLFGYYQYQSNISTTFETSRLAIDGSWKLIDHILNVGIPNDAIHLNELAQMLSLDAKKTLECLLEAKKMGYEIRSNVTNPQIADDHFLIPYAFPTLNNRSVQLSKSLI